jgi:hypothetical protein
MRSKNWTIEKPNPISETAVRIHDIMVRSTLSRVRSTEMGIGRHPDLEPVCTKT